MTMFALRKNVTLSPAIARQPALEAKFQVSKAPGRAALGRIKQE